MKKSPVKQLKDGSYIWDISPFRWIESLELEQRLRLERVRTVDYPERLECYNSRSQAGILS